MTGYNRRDSIKFFPIKGREIIVEGRGLLFWEYIRKEFYRYLPGLGRVVSSRANTIKEGDFILFRSFSLYLSEDRTVIAVPTASIIGTVTPKSPEFEKYLEADQVEKNKMHKEFWDRRMVFDLKPVPGYVFGVMLGKYPVEDEEDLTLVHAIDKVKTVSIIILSDGDGYKRGDVVEVFPDSLYYLDPIHGLIIVPEKDIIGKVQDSTEILIGLKQLEWLDEFYEVIPPDFVLIGEDAEVDEYRFNLLRD